jgi:decaprenyl-phosphate phosphoribosyltransferase
VSVTSTTTQAVGLLRLVRPRQWIKNAFVLAPLVFAHKFNDPTSIIDALTAFALFCVASSAGYILNDVVDCTLIAGLLWSPATMLAIFTYVGLNVAYTYVLKHQPVLDLFSIALGFVLRVYAGAQALSVPLSSWMAITTLCLALYLAAIKRRQ